MANATLTRPGAGETRLGTTRDGALESQTLQQSPIGTASCFAMQTTAGVTYYLWVDTTGDLRIYTARPVGAEAQSIGVVVGSQS